MSLSFIGLSPHGDISISPDILVPPRPAFAVVLKHNPNQIMFRAIVNQDLCQAFAIRSFDREWWVKL